MISGSQIYSTLLGIPSAVLQPAERAHGAHEAERGLLHLQGERHADILWLQCDRRAGLRHPGDDEESPVWRPRCGGVQPHPGDTMEQECHHLQVSVWSFMIFTFKVE